MEWTPELEEYLAKSLDLTDKAIAEQLTFITGEAVTAGAVTIKRKRLGLLKRPSPGRGWGTRWNAKNNMG